MPESSIGLVLLVIILALLFDFFNGFNDAANAIATVISTRALSPTAAISMAAVLNFVGALAGTAVAKTVGTGLVDSEVITLESVGAAAAAAAIWVLIASRLGLPVSGSHSLIAGIIGAGIAIGGLDILVGSGIRKVLLGLALAPLVGIFAGYLVMLSLLWLFQNTSPSTVNNLFGRLQILSAGFMAFSHGTNDAQKTMGIITLALLVGGRIDEFSVPLWVIFLSGSVIAIGTAAGGQRVIRTVGMRIVKLRTIDGFAAETTAASIIEAASRLGFPLSTTHTITSGILGVGSTKRLSAVRWGVAWNIVLAWVFTFPITGVLGAVLALLAKQVF
ncbi:MAG: inorganic phosphate transporter [Dehalococcoidia bacterium]